MSEWKGLFTCSCGRQQACHEDSICNAKQMCVKCIAKNYWTDRPNNKLDWDSPIAAVLVWYLTKGKEVRGI